jgi:hypothetical protein
MLNPLNRKGVQLAEKTIRETNFHKYVYDEKIMKNAKTQHK